MGVMSGFHHVKLPVADVSRSRDWYGRVLGFEVALEFIEDRVVMGVALRDPSGTVRLAVRHDPARAAALSGFDPIALAVPARADVQAWRARLDDLGEPHGGIVTGHEGGPCSSACTTPTASKSGSTSTEFHSQPRIEDGMTNPDQPPLHVLPVHGARIEYTDRREAK